MPAVDIVIPVYNQSRSLRGCLDAIRSQTFQDLSVTVVDDGSTDDVRAAIAAHRGQIRFIQQENRGAAAARNLGAQEGKAPYILFCDADCTIKNNFLSTQHKLLDDHRESSYVYSNFTWGWKTFRPGPFSAERLRQEPYINTHSLLRREHFPGFDESLKRFQDWDLWLTMLEHGHTGIWIDEILFAVQPGGTMSTWLPSFAYRLLPWLPTVRQYQAAAAIIKAKHGAVKNEAPRL